MDSAGCVERIPDVDFVRAELIRNQRERSLLLKLLKLAERKAIIAGLSESEQSEVRHDA